MRKMPAQKNRTTVRIHGFSLGRTETLASSYLRSGGAAHFSKSITHFCEQSFRAKRDTVRRNCRIKIEIKRPFHCRFKQNWCALERRPLHHFQLTIVYVLIWKCTPNTVNTRLITVYSYRLFVLMKSFVLSADCYALPFSILIKTAFCGLGAYCQINSLQNRNDLKNENAEKRNTMQTWKNELNWLIKPTNGVFGERISVKTKPHYPHTINVQRDNNRKLNGSLQTHSIATSLVINGSSAIRKNIQSNVCHAKLV